jgi:hypothetical protein
MIRNRRHAILKAMSHLTFILAFASAVLVLALRLIRCFLPDLISWKLKSALPLMLAGTAFACLQFALPRTRRQIVLGLLVATAFILWGIEQFVSNHAVAAWIDDIVVFLFVLDLCLVIRGQLKESSDAAKAAE